MKGIVQSEILKKTTKILSGKNIPVYTEGFQPRVEYDAATKQPVRVFIPEVPDNAKPELISAIHGYIDHECGHILESDAEDICDTSKGKLWGYIHNCIEDPRVNAKMSDRYAGSEANIRRGYNFLFDREPPKGGINPYSKEAVDAIDMTNEEAVKDAQVNYSSMWFARKADCRFSSKKYDEIGLDKLFKPLEAKCDARYLDALSRAHTAEEVREAADYFSKFFHKEFDEDGSGKGSPKEGGEKGKDPATAKKGGSRLKDPKKMEDELAEAIFEEIEHLAKTGKKNFHFSDRFDVIHSKHDIATLGGSKLPESIADFENETKTVTNYLTKDIRRLLESRNRRWYVGGYKSGKLNQKALHTVKIGNDRIFSKKNDIKQVKAAVSLLIDMSGSMSGPRGKGADGKPVQPKIEVAIKSAYAFAMVLDQLKVPYEVWGFSTNTIQPPEKIRAWDAFAKTATPDVLSRAIAPYTYEDLYAFKTFEENFDYISKVAMVRTANAQVRMQNNEDSLHVKRALERLGSRPEEKKTLFVFSDGMPCFGPGEVRPAMEMLKYLDSVSKSHYGVDIFGIGIMSDSVLHYYKNHKTVHELMELPNALFEFLKSRI